MNSTVSKGLATWMGYGAAVAAAIAPIIGQLSDATEPLGVSPGVWIVVSGLLTAITTIGRQWQQAATNANQQPPAPGNVEIDGMAVDAHEGAER